MCVCICGYGLGKSQKGKTSNWRQIWTITVKQCKRTHFLKATNEGIWGTKDQMKIKIHDFGITGKKKTTTSEMVWRTTGKLRNVVVFFVFLKKSKSENKIKWKKYNWIHHISIVSDYITQPSVLSFLSEMDMANMASHSGQWRLPMWIWSSPSWYFEIRCNVLDITQ